MKNAARPTPITPARLAVGCLLSVSMALGSGLSHSAPVRIDESELEGLDLNDPLATRSPIRPMVRALTPTEPELNVESARGGVDLVTTPGDGFGSALAACDFDGDGALDLAIGIPDEDARSDADIGVVIVIYGGGEGLQVTDLATQYWRQSTPGVPNLLSPGDQFGFALAAGDFNGDAFCDLAIGVPGENHASSSASSVPDAGYVHVIYGTDAGLQASAPGIPDTQGWHQNRPGIPDRLESGDRFGAALAAGDFNNDSYDDLAIGVPGEDLGTIVDAGLVNVLYGSSSGIQTASPVGQKWTQGNPQIQNSPQADDHFGASLAAGDFDLDGFVDLAIGVPDEDLGPVADPIVDAGLVHVIYGCDGAGLCSTGNQAWHQKVDGIADTIEAGDRFGAALAAGISTSAPTDYGFLAIGVPGEDIGATADAGIVHVLYDCPGSPPLCAAGSQVWHQDSNGIVGRAESGDGFGSALATGDFNNDGDDDLAVGVPDEDLGSIVDAGYVNVIYYCGGVSLCSDLNEGWAQPPDGTGEMGAGTGDGFGSVLAAGDLDGNGLSDLVIGVPSDTCHAVAGAGRINVLYGAWVSNDWGLTSTIHQADWTQNTQGVPDSCE